MPMSQKYEHPPGRGLLARGRSDFNSKGGQPSIMPKASMWGCGGWETERTANQGIDMLTQARAGAENSRGEG